MDQGASNQEGAASTSTEAAGAAAVISCPAPAHVPAIPDHLWRLEVTEEAKCKL